MKRKRLFISELKRDGKVQNNMERLVHRTCSWAENLKKKKKKKMPTMLG